MKILAARRAKSVSDLLAEQIEVFARSEEAASQKAYDEAHLQAMVFLDRGLKLGGVIPVSREEWHKR